MTAPAALIFAVALAWGGCGGELVGQGPSPDVVVMADLGVGDATTDGRVVEAPDQGGGDLTEPDTQPPPPPECPCFVQEAWCGSGVAKEAQKRGCTVPLLPEHASDILHCPDGKWSVKESCADGCVEEAPGTPDHCKPPPAPPECPCFVQVAWCGSGVAKEAQKRNCTVPLLPEHESDILYCPNGKWSVKETCAEGCFEAPAGTPDYCKSTGTSPVPGYKVTTPYGVPGSWAAGYHTGEDYAAPTGTSVVATRAGVVKLVNGWGSAYGYHVVIETSGVRHGYAHLSKILVSTGQSVGRGQRVGRVGSTGNSTGPHLHYEERVSPFGYWDHRKPQFSH